MRIEVEGLYVNNHDSSISAARDHLKMGLPGIFGDRHFGFIMPSGSRDREQLGDPNLPKGVAIRNWRQWSAVSVEELSQIARNLNVPNLDASLLGANLCFSGVAALTQLPRGTALHFPEDAILLVEAENLPCINPGREIAKVYPVVNPSHFAKAAIGLRGLVGVVHRPGIVKVGDIAMVSLYEPKFYSTPPSKQ